MFFFFKQKTADEMSISDWSSDVCSSDLAVSRRALLWAVANGMPLPPPVPPAGSQSVAPAEDVPPGFFHAIGYVPAGRRAIRRDRLEALAVAAGPLHRKGPVAATPQLATTHGKPGGWSCSGIVDHDT